MVSGIGSDSEMMVILSRRNRTNMGSPMYTATPTASLDIRKRRDVFALEAVFGVLLFGIPESEMGRNTVLGYKSCMEEIKDGVMGNPPDSSKIPEFFGMDGERLGYFALLAAVKYYLYEFGETPDFIVHCGQIARKLELASQEIIPAVQR